jgi:hypothetical protein
MEHCYMRGNSAPGSIAPKGWIADFRSWLRTCSNESWQPFEDLPSEAAGPHAPSQGSVRVLVVDDTLSDLETLSGTRAANDGFNAAIRGKE